MTQPERDAMPDEKPIEPWMSEKKQCYREGWNDCRASMLERRTFAPDQSARIERLEAALRKIESAKMETGENMRFDQFRQIARAALEE